MLADIGHPTAAELGRFLGVSVRTVRRWLEQGHAPRPVMLALFWLTRWGRSQVECAAVNDAKLMAAQARASESESARRLAELELVLRLADFGAANSPIARDHHR